MNDKTPEIPKEENKKEEVKPTNSEHQDKKEPFGKGVKPAMYILFDETKNMFFVLGAPGFLDDPVRAYGALRIAEKNLDDFYLQKKSIGDKLTAGVKNFQNKMNMRGFLRGR